VFGVGINDSNYVVQKTVDGKRAWCKIYEAWHGMLKRCYNKNSLNKRPMYEGCSVSPDWHTFSKFKLWMESQDWQGKRLDKDLLIFGNKVYSSDTCIFISQLTNSFINEQPKKRGGLPIGVSWHSASNKFHASCSNPFLKKKEYLGLHSDPHKAHLAWKKRKHELACQLADLQTDERAAKALRTKYL
jgi:hypothetical protein